MDGFLSGAAWVGRFIAKLLDLVGFGEIMDLLWQIIKFNTRPLSQTEITEAKRVFGDSIAYWQVRVDEYSLIATLGALLKGSAGMGVTLFHTINFNRKITPTPGSPDMGWLIHEMAPTPQEAPESRWRVTMQFTPQVPIRVVGTPTFSPMARDYFAFPVGVMRNWEGVPAGNRWHFFGQPEFDLNFFPLLSRGNWSFVLQDNLLKLTILKDVLEATLVAGLSIQQGNTPKDWSLIGQPAGQLAWHPFGPREVWYREFQVLLNAGLNWTIPFAGPPGPLPPQTLDVVIGAGVRLELPH